MLKIRFPVYLFIIFSVVLTFLFLLFDAPKFFKQQESERAFGSDNSQPLIVAAGVEGLQTETSSSITGSGNFTSD